MTIYTYTGGGDLFAPRYYFIFGGYVFACLGLSPDDGAFTPFNSEIMGAAYSNDPEEKRAFLLNLSPYSPAVISRWPLPVYGTAGEENLDILVEFLALHFIPRYWEAYLLPFGESDNGEEMQKVYRAFFDRFLHLMTATFWKYVPLIAAYKAKESALLDKLGAETRSLTRFNDTPQETGDFSDEEHTTTATQTATTSESDYLTPIQRLKEIRDNWENLYNAWALEFDILFTKGGSLEDE